MIKVLVADDETLARDEIIYLLKLCTNFFVGARLGKQNVAYSF